MANFLRDISQQAVASDLARIGTAAALLSDEFKDEYGTIDWDEPQATEDEADQYTEQDRADQQAGDSIINQRKGER
ncbi:MAG TPA: hypothetical protein VIR29_00935 [Anseongella sp.]